MFAEIVDEALLFFFSAAVGLGVGAFIDGNQSNGAMGDAIVNPPPRFLDGRERDAEFGGKLLVRSSLKCGKEEPLFTPAKAELRRWAKEKRANP